MAREVSLLALARSCLYVGMVGYGGPAAMGHMREMFVGKRGWVSEEEFRAGLGLSQMIPGATSVNLATFIGYRLAGIPGAILAPAVFLIPASILIVVLSALYFQFHSVAQVGVVFSGLGAVVVALTAKATLSLGKSAIDGAWSVVIAAAAFACVRFLHMPILWEVAGSAGMGLLIYGLRPDSVSAGHQVSPSPRTRGSRGVALVAVVAVIAASVVARLGVEGQVMSTFARIGLLTFGGGYAAVPLIQHEVVDKLRWVGMQEFQDGIVLGQVTPGPVLMTACFIGYKVAGLAGALASTVGVFMPPALITLILSNQHARVQQNPLVRAIFRGIVAGFIGVLLTIVLRFATSSLVDARTWTIGLASAIALIGFGSETLLVIAGGIVVSLVWTLVG